MLAMIMFLLQYISKKMNIEKQGRQSSLGVEQLRKQVKGSDLGQLSILFNNNNYKNSELGTSNSLLCANN